MVDELPGPDPQPAKMRPMAKTTPLLVRVGGVREKEAWSREV